MSQSMPKRNGNGAGEDLLLMAFQSITDIRDAVRDTQDAIQESQAGLKRVDKGLQTLGRNFLKFVRHYRSEMADVRRRLSALETAQS